MTEAFSFILSFSLSSLFIFLMFVSEQVSSQTSIKTVEFSLPLSPNISVPQQSMIESKLSSTSKSWMTVKEPIGVWSENNFTVQGMLEHLNVTKDYSDYLWHITQYVII